MNTIVAFMQLKSLQEWPNLSTCWWGSSEKTKSTNIQYTSQPSSASFSSPIPFLLFSVTTMLAWWYYNVATMKGISPFFVNFHYAKSNNYSSLMQIQSTLSYFEGNPTSQPLIWNRSHILIMPGKNSRFVDFLSHKSEWVFNNQLTASWSLLPIPCTTLFDKIFF